MGRVLKKMKGRHTQRGHRTGLWVSAHSVWHLNGQAMTYLQMIIKHYKTWSISSFQTSTLQVSATVLVHSDHWRQKISIFSWFSIELSSTLNSCWYKLKTVQLHKIMQPKYQPKWCITKYFSHILKISCNNETIRNCYFFIINLQCSL